MQQGTINQVPDHRIGTGTLSITGSEATLAESVDMKAQNAIVGFSIKDITGENDLNPDVFSIRRADDGVIAMVTNSQSFCYIALPPSPAETWFKALTSVDGKTQTYIAKGTAKLEAGKYYPTELKMATVGDVILSNGKFAAPKTEGAEAMIAYLGNAFAGGDGEATTTHGLAIALEDAFNGTCQWSSAATNISNYADSHKINGDATGWRLPSEDDFKYMFQACSGDEYISTKETYFKCGNLGTMITAVGGFSFGNMEYGYWTSTEDDSSIAYAYYFNIERFSIQRKGSYLHVRAVLAF